MSSSQINGSAAELARLGGAIVEEQQGFLPGGLGQISFERRTRALRDQGSDADVSCRAPG
jgi:hypothetical protein